MSRYVSVDVRYIRHTSVTPFEEDEGLYGINWDLVGGGSGSDLIGSKADAEAELHRIWQQQRLRVASSNA